MDRQGASIRRIATAASVEGAPTLISSSCSAATPWKFLACGAWLIVEAARKLVIMRLNIRGSLISLRILRHTEFPRKVRLHPIDRAGHLAVMLTAVVEGNNLVFQPRPVCVTMVEVMLTACILTWCLFIASICTAMFLEQKICNDVEEGIPMAQRPSLTSLNGCRVAFDARRRHRQLYPQSSLRSLNLSAWGTAAISLIATLFLTSRVFGP